MLAKEKKSAGNVAKSCQSSRPDFAQKFAGQDGGQSKKEDLSIMACSKKSVSYVALSLKHKNLDKSHVQQNVHTIMTTINHMMQNSIDPII